MKKNKSEKRDRVTGYPILDKKVREGLPEEATDRQTPRQSEGEVHAAMREKMQMPCLLGLRHQLGPGALPIGGTSQKTADELVIIWAGRAKKECNYVK